MYPGSPKLLVRARLPVPHPFSRHSFQDARAIQLFRCSATIGFVATLWW